MLCKIVCCRIFEICLKKDTSRRGARVVEWASLENCCKSNLTESSNLSLSAKLNSNIARMAELADALYSGCSILRMCRFKSCSGHNIINLSCIYFIFLRDCPDLKPLLREVAFSFVIDFLPFILNSVGSSVRYYSHCQKTYYASLWCSHRYRLYK
jgi:hypothetical protein